MGREGFTEDVCRRRGLIQWVDQELHRVRVVPRGARLLVAVSGGADSVGLLHILQGVNGSRFWNWTLVVGHVDHGIRGRESVEDARFVRGVAKAEGIRCVTRRLKLGVGTSEGVARAGRLAALKSMVKKERCAGVVMGHHADDQAETVLLRLMRGCGLEGLAGMAARSSVGGLVIFRPLLGVRREAIREYLRGLGQGWREDVTNGSSVYLRNRVRSELLPVMEAMAPGAVTAMGRAAVLAGQAGEVLGEDVCQLMLAAKVGERKSRVTFRREILREAHPFLCAEVFRAVIGRMGGSTEVSDFERLREAVRIVQANAGGKCIQLGKRITLRVDGASVCISRAAAKKRGKK